LSDPFSGDFPFKLSEGKQNIADNIGSRDVGDIACLEILCTAHGAQNLLWFVLPVAECMDNGFSLVSMVSIRRASGNS